MIKPSLIAKKTGISTLILSLCLSTGCTSLQSTMDEMGLDKQKLGAVAGGALGLLAGSQVGGGRGRTLAMITGGIAGAYLGGVIGRKLDAKDRIAATQALENLDDNASHTFTNPDTGKTTTFTVNNTRKVVREMPIVRRKQVAKASAIELIGKPYKALKNANLRNAPSTSGTTVVGGLKAGEVFTAVGKVSQQPWIMVAQNNITIGYIHKSLVAETTIQQELVLREAVDLDAMDEKTRAQSNYAAVDLDADLVVEQVAVNTNCRDINFSQQGSNNNFKACKAADGAWEII